MNDLLAAAAFFVGTHLAISNSQLRPQLISRFGENGYRGLYSLVSIIGLIWMIVAYRRAPFEPSWLGGSSADIATFVLMPLAAFFIVAGNSTPNPTSVGQAPDPDASEPARGIIRVTRHPTMWGVGIWATLHVFAANDVASVIFFGALIVLSLAGAQVLDIRRNRESAPGWGVFVQATSFVPFWAIIQGRQRFVWSEIGLWRVALSLSVYVIIVLVHPWLSGVSLTGLI